MRATYKTIAKMKQGGVNHERPSTFLLGKKLSKNKNPSKFLDEEHQKNLASLQRRMVRIGTVIQN